MSISAKGTPEQLVPLRDDNTTERLERAADKLGHIQRTNGTAIAEIPIGPVALRLLGKPVSATETEYKYNGQGLLIIDLTNGIWSDLATGEDGDTHKLVMRGLGCDWARAQDWLSREGFGGQTLKTIAAAKPPGGQLMLNSGGAEKQRQTRRRKQAGDHSDDDCEVTKKQNQREPKRREEYSFEKKLAEEYRTVPPPPPATPLEPLLCSDGGNADKTPATPEDKERSKENAQLDREIVDRDELDALAKMSVLEYGRQRREAAKRLGITVGTLDRVIKEKRAAALDESTELPHWKVHPWSEPVDGAKLLASVKAIFVRYVILPSKAAEALALWVLHAWAFEAWDISPFMVMVSPEKRCGKTTVLIILQFLTPRSELASNISAAAIFRYVEDQRPTLLIDEADTFVKDNEEMRGVLNSGHTRTGAYVIRTEEIAGERGVRRFSTWAPKAIATIRALADTLADRAIQLTMQRKAKHQIVERLRRRDNDEFVEIRRKAMRWATDNLQALTAADPSVPDELNDRAADNWRPLFAIADQAGGNWPKEARAAAQVLSGCSIGDASLGEQLLADIRPLFADPGVVELGTTAIIAELVKDASRPWADWRDRGKPITAKTLAGFLKPFRIHSCTLYTSEHPKGIQGYKRADFEHAFAAYLPSPSPTNPSNGPEGPEGQESQILSGVSQESGNLHRTKPLTR